MRNSPNNAKALPEHDRTGLQRAAINIEDITNYMLNHYKPRSSLITKNNQRQHVLVSTIDKKLRELGAFS